MTVYGALVTRVAVRPHPNADRLALGQIGGTQVVVSKDTADGTLGLFFSSELAVSDEYATANKLRSADGGFFPNSLKVRPQSFRGQRSDGYFAPLDSVAFTGFDTSLLTEGMVFDELNGVPIASKYVSQAVLDAQARGQAARVRKVNPYFAKHTDTEQWLYNKGDIPAESLITITEKLHGTSGRTGYVWDETPAPAESVWRRALKILTWNHEPTVTKRLTTLTGTRNTVLGQYQGEDFYGTSEFRDRASALFEGKLHVGEVVYYEIVGWANADRPIMERHNFSGFQDKAVKAWGDGVTYNYGTLPGSIDVYVYRITRTTDDVNGWPVTTELSWNQVKARCDELGVKHVPQLNYQRVLGNAPHVLAELDAEIDAMANDHVATRFGGHPREGVVIRIDTPDGRTYSLKHKSFLFKLGEGLAAEQGAKDMEELS